MELNFGKNPEYKLFIGLNAHFKYGHFALPIGLFWWYGNDEYYRTLDFTLNFLCFTFSIEYWRDKE